VEAAILRKRLPTRGRAHGQEPLVGSTIRAVLKTEITCDKHLYVWPSVTSVAASAHADAEAWQTKKNTAAAMDNTTVHQAG
jgi:hypothetical protein